MGTAPTPENVIPRLGAEEPLGSLAQPGQPLTEEAIAQAMAWLQAHPLWQELGDAGLGAIAHSLRQFSIPANTEIYRKGQAPVGLYLLQSGTVQLCRPSAVGPQMLCHPSRGDLFGYVPLVDPSVSPVYEERAIALTPCNLWLIPKAEFNHLRDTLPQLLSLINHRLVQDLTSTTHRLDQEEARLHDLQPYMRSIPTESSLTGSSKYARKLRQTIDKASGDLQPIVLRAAPGTGKTYVSGLIHRQSALADSPFAELDCAHILATGSAETLSHTLFGRESDTPGLLERLEQGTLLLDNSHLLSSADWDRLTHYAQTGAVQRCPANALAPSSHETPCSVRLILASPQSLSFGPTHHALKLPALTQHKADIPDLARDLLRRFCQEQGRDPLQLDQADLRRLISYPYPGNLRELASILERAVYMTPPGHTLIPEQVLWSVQSAKNAFRIDLLNHIPWLRQFLLSRWWPEGVWIPMMVIFVPAVVMGYVGPQSRDASFTLNLFWAWWWPLYLFFFAFVGRVWCAVCPFMIAGEWLRRLSLWIWPRQLLPWPTRWLNRWGAWVMFGGFLVIYLWEKLWDLPHSAYLSAWLLVAIASGAILFSQIYERRLWCRYLCPIGGMNGMFAKLSMLELRSTQQVCGSQCNTFSCYKGSDATPVNFPNPLPTEGQATDGCPLYSHPAQLPDNRDCMLCMTCLKGCPNRSAQLSLRFPATDLLEGHRAFWAEVALLLLLLGGVFMHHGQKILGWLGYESVPLDSAHLLSSLPIVLALLSIPALLTYATHRLSRLFDPDLPDYLTTVYAYLPLTLAANLTHYIPAAITEAGQILPVTARTFGISGHLLPSLTWSPDVAAFLQGVTLLSILVFSPYPLYRITQRPWPSLMPHLLMMLGLTTFFFYLMV